MSAIRLSLFDRGSAAIPNSSNMYRKKSLGPSRVLKMKAVFVSSSIRPSSVWISVVLPVPTSPVSRMNPFRSWIPYNRFASASLWLSLRKRKCGSGVTLKGFAVSL